MAAAVGPTTVLFDLDGTLVDPGRGVSLAVEAACAALGLNAPLPAVMRRFVGPPLQDGFRELLGLTEADLPVAVSAFRASYRSGGILDYDLYVGVPELLAELDDGGLLLAVATSKPEEFALQLLEHAGLIGRFAVVCGATLDGATRHKEQVVRNALDAAAVAPASAVLLGDRGLDVLGAAACGVPTIGAGWGYGSHDELVDAGAHAVAGSPADVSPLLAAMGTRLTC